MVEVAGFNQVLQTLAQLDFFTLLLPFLLAFALFYFLVKNIPLWDNFDDDGMQDKLAGVIALSASFFVAYFLSQTPAYQMFFVDYFGRLTIALVGLLGLLILLGFAGIDVGKPIPIIVILAALALLGAFGVSGGFEPFLPEHLLWFEAEQVVSILFETGLIYLLLIAGSIWWLVAYNDEEEDDSTSPIRTLVESMD